MTYFQSLPPEEKYLIIKNEIYSFLEKSPEHWKNKGYLIKKPCISNKGKESFKYDVSEKAYKELSGIFERRIKRRLFVSSLKEKVNTLVARNANVNLLNLMEA